MSEILQIGKIHPNGENQQQARVYDTQWLYPTLMDGETQWRYLIKQEIDMGKDITLKQIPHGFNSGFEYKRVCPTITTSSFEHNNFIIEKEMEKKNQITLPKELEGKKFRIRKLTPRECFRLMGVDDADIDKIQASGVSNSAQYKLAGNSIVVDVLFHIFRKMFIEQENENQQLSLF